MIHRWHVISCISPFSEIDLKYKEFKKSLVNNAFNEGKFGFIRLLLISDKSIIKTNHIPLILGSETMFSELGDLIANIKIPQQFNRSIHHALVKSIRLLKPHSLSVGENKSNHNLISFIKKNIDTYGKDNNLGSKLLPLIDSCDL